MLLSLEVTNFDNLLSCLVSLVGKAYLVRPQSIINWTLWPDILKIQWYERLRNSLIALHPP